LRSPDGVAAPEGLAPARPPARASCPPARASCAPARASWRTSLAALGPGLVVMLADTDAGSILTAAQTGVETGYALIPLQLAVIPLLFLAQELAARLVLGTGRGMIELLRARLGRGAALAAAAVLTLTCFGALVTQLSGMAAVAEFYGARVDLAVAVAVIGLSAMILTGSYRSVERIALLFGAAEFAFLYAGWKAHPDFSRIAADASALSAHAPRLLFLVAANLGATIMPWAIFYQQSAAGDKGLARAHLGHARVDTLLGAALCQFVTCGVQIVAATHAATVEGAGSVAEFARLFGHALHGPIGAALFCAGLMGGALVATVVVCLAAAWAVGEAAGRRHSLEQHPREAPWFYGSFVALLAGAGAFVAAGVDAVRLSMAVGVLNALLLPMALLCLFWLARKTLGPDLRPSGALGAATGAAFVLVSALGLYAGVVGVLG
jgi:Mn2+/Fe2+ NRAMP family transporter